ncbi:metalloregulator ArsR/SmtB family transcription factor [Thermosulfurimonas sp.]|uniref:ArsR/SmtB family transcription factor n=1 Tax=Thermosulfurimonas sp. TaxID=2080236 RepID=UPI0025E4F46C|nr:metalloregulator ArsR/SmtB family transcription factor [Thermosulfurimonas sp.]
MNQAQRRLLILFKALADENRLRILEELKGGERSVTELVESLGISQPLVSHHLRELKLAGLVDRRKQGPFVFYRIRDLRIFDLLNQAQSLFPEAGNEEGSL